MSIEETLAGFALEPVAGEGAREMMRLSLFDWAACGIAGEAEPLAAILRGKALDEGGAAAGFRCGRRLWSTERSAMRLIMTTRILPISGIPQ
jgi:2-methylcitrate dehydratase PrpD